MFRAFRSPCNFQMVSLPKSIRDFFHSRVNNQVDLAVDLYCLVITIKTGVRAGAGEALKRYLQVTSSVGD